MSDTRLNRRNFLRVSAAAGGGFVLGFNWFIEGAAAAVAVPKVGAEAQHGINAFLTISEDGLVTIFSPNPEIGQNVKTSMPMLVAEELDVDWASVKVRQAGLDTNKYTRQLAGGSQSIRSGWNGLRMAGATARQMLLEAAAERLQVPIGELSTSMGVISHEASERSVGYGDVAADAAGREVPTDVSLKSPEDFAIIGTSRKNVDGPALVQGKPLFGIDVQREGMLIAGLVHAPAFGMKIKSVDTEAARAMPGIVDVVTIDVTLPSENRFNPNAFPQTVAVVGHTTWEVMQAKQKVVVEWEEDSAPESTEEHSAGLASLMESGTPQSDRRDGDPDAAFRDASVVIDRTYSTPIWAHNTLEPMNFFADVKEDSAYLLGPIQTPEFMRRFVSEALGLPEEKITIDLTRMGGGFGRRLYSHFGLEAAMISKAVGSPVKLVYSREDDMTQGTYRPTYQVRYRAALDDGGNLTGFHVRGAGMNDLPVFENRFPAGTVDNYLAENLRLDSNVSIGAFRAPRSNFIAGAEQCFLDEVAEAVGKDPIDFRLELFERAQNDPVGENNDYDPARYAGVLKLVREKSGWDNAVDGVHRGVSAYYCHNSYVAQVIDLVMVNGRPVVKKVWAAVDCGIVVNPDAARNQIEGGIVDGIGHGMYGQMTLTNGKPDHDNFDSYRLIRIHEAPEEIEVFFVDNGIDPTGLGEPGLPPAISALANALASATGKRLYDQPFSMALEELRVQGPTG